MAATVTAKCGILCCQCCLSCPEDSVHLGWGLRKRGIGTAAVGCTTSQRRCMADFLIADLSPKAARSLIFLLSSLTIAYTMSSVTAPSSRSVMPMAMMLLTAMPSLPGHCIPRRWTTCRGRMSMRQKLPWIHSRFSARRLRTRSRKELLRAWSWLP